MINEVDLITMFCRWLPNDDLINNNGHLVTCRPILKKKAD